MNETQTTLKRLFDIASVKLTGVQSPAEAETQMADFLRAVRASPEQREFVIGLFEAALQGPSSPWEFIQFCLHSLRWPEMYNFIKVSKERDIDNLRARSIWEHLLSAFDDDWEDAEFYREFRTRRNERG